MERLRPLRAPAVGRRAGGGNVRYGIAGDALHGHGEDMVGDIRGHNSSPFAKSFVQNDNHSIPQKIAKCQRKRYTIFKTKTGDWISLKMWRNYIMKLGIGVQRPDSISPYLPTNAAKA